MFRVSSAASSWRFRALGDPDLVGWRREALEEFLRVPRTENSRRVLRWYEERNPRWREGYGLPVLVETNRTSIFHGSLRALGLG
jgi:hypothetical protein